MPGNSVWALDKAHFFFYLELFGTVALPAILLTFSEVRNSIKGLYWAVAYRPSGGCRTGSTSALPAMAATGTSATSLSAIEIIITLALIAGGILIFDFGTRYLPVYQSELSGEAH